MISYNYNISIDQLYNHNACCFPFLEATVNLDDLLRVHSRSFEYVSEQLKDPKMIVLYIHTPDSSYRGPYLNFRGANSHGKIYPKCTSLRPQWLAIRS